MLTAEPKRRPTVKTGFEIDDDQEFSLLLLSVPRERYYHPFIGRFLSEDPIRQTGGDENLYRLTGNDPINLVDPSGQSVGGHRLLGSVPVSQVLHEAMQEALDDSPSDKQRFSVGGVIDWAKVQAAYRDPAAPGLAVNVRMYNRRNPVTNLTLLFKQNVDRIFQIKKSLYADRGIEVRPDDLGPVSTREPIIRGDSGNEIAAQYDLRLVWERARNLAMGLAELGKFTASAGFDPLDPNALEPLFHKVDQVVRLYTEYHDQIIALEKDDKTLVDATWFFLGDNALNILSETLKKPSSFGTLGPSTRQAKEEIGAVRELSKSLTGLNERNKAAEVTLEVTEWVLDAVQIAAGVYGFATVLKLAAKEAGEAAVAKGLEGIAVKQAERRAAVWAAVKELSKTGAIVAGFAGAAAGLQKLVDSKDLPPSTLVWVQAGLLALQVIPAVRARLKAAQLAEDSLSVEEHAVATSAVSNSAAIDEPAPRSTATAAENAERETTDAAAKHLEKMTTKEGQRVLRVAQNLEEGTLLEQQAKLGRQLADEVIIESQYQQGAADKGFDFLSIKGSGQNAQLFINEVKDEFGRVGSRRFTALGLGKLGLATFNQATDVAEQAIRSSANLDPQTKATVLRQLRSGGAKIRLIGSENTNFAPDVIRKIERFTGFVVEEIINSRK